MLETITPSIRLLLVEGGWLLKRERETYLPSQLRPTRATEVGNGGESRAMEGTGSREDKQDKVSYS